MRSVLFIAIALIALVYCDQVKWTTCQDNPVITVTSIDVTPIVAKPGQNVTSLIRGTTSQVVTAGDLTVDVFLKGVRLFQFKYDICKLGKPCPLAVGDFEATVIQNVPSFAFQGTYTTKNQATSSTGVKLSCVSFDFDVKK